MLLQLVGPRTPPLTPPPPIVSELDPLGLMDPPRIQSPSTGNITRQRWKAKMEYRRATREWQEAGLLPRAKAVDAAPEFDCYGRPIPRPREWYYPTPHNLARELGWNLVPREVQYDRGVLLRQLPSNKAKAPPSPRSRVREGQVQQRTEPDWDSQAMDFDS